MSRGFEHDERDFEERNPETERQARMPLSQGRGGGSGSDQLVPHDFDLNELRDRIDRAAEGSPTVEQFLERLGKEAVRPIPSIQSNGRWNGISYEFAGVRVTGSKLGRAYTATGLQRKKGIGYNPARDDARLRSLAPIERSARSSADPREQGDRDRFRGAISSQEEKVLWEAARFRTVAVSDLARQHYAGDYSRLERDLKHLTKLGLAERHTIPTDGRGRTLSVVTLTKTGKKLLSATDRTNRSSSQAIYTGLVKPRELAHDAAIYRMYLAEAACIDANGGRVHRVVLDYELKQKVYSPLAKAHDLAPLARAERQQEIADENKLPVVDGRIALPDLRIEYETPDGETRHVDLELATRNYRAAHIRTKAAAGFKVYADTNSGPLSRVFDNHNLIVELLRT